MAEFDVDDLVYGIFVQLFLFDSISVAEESDILCWISLVKDVDGLYLMNLGWFVVGEEGFVVCILLGCMWLLVEMDVMLSGKRVVVIGCSIIVGKFMVLLLI